MIDLKLYSQIIADWVIGRNVQKGVDIIYNDSKNMNEEVMNLLSIPDESVNQDDLDKMNTILIISNILYNNTSQNVLPLEDGIYDLLIVKYKNLTGQDIVGAPPVRFPDNISINKPNQELIPGIIYLTDEENDYINNMIFHDDIYKNKVLTPRDMLYPGVTYERIVSKRLKDTSHNNPELVGTLDKAKFVLMKQAKDKGVDQDLRVKILERDFFAKQRNPFLISLL